MAPYRNKKILSALQEAGADFLKKNYDWQGLVTITGARLEEKGRSVSILFTVLPESEEENTLRALRRLRGDFRQFVENETRINRPPKVFDFEIDLGEKNRQNIERLEAESKNKNF